MSDSISRQAAIDQLHQSYNLLDAERRLEDMPSAQSDPCEELDFVQEHKKIPVVLDIQQKGKSMPSAQPEQRWIPFKTRPLTEEEKEEHPEWDCILDCKLPDDGQEILVSINLRGYENVQYDVFYTDDGSYLDSGYEIGEEATAWMPLPKAYREDDTK